MYEFEPGDYIAFTRIVQNERPFKFRTDYSTGRALVDPAIPEQVVPQAGVGQIVSISANLRKVGDEKFIVGRVAAGKPIGTVTAILDDAILAGKQESLFDMAPAAKSDKFSQYGSDGIA